MLKEFLNILTSRALWEQPILDLWTVPHFLSGIIIALLIRYKNINLWFGFFISLILSILWEISEHFLSLSRAEYFSNQIADIVFAQIGFLVGVFLLKQKAKKSGLLHTTSIMVGVFLVLVLFGWLSFRSYVSAF